MTPISHIAVLIPARDEEVLLPRCLKSMNQACRLLPRDVTTDVIVVSDQSTDNTYEKAAKLLRTSGIAFSTNVGLVGAARSTAAEIALRRFDGELNRCWLANTDADCEVPETWLCDQLEIARRGHVAVAGIVDVDSFEEHLPGVESLFRSSYLIAADGTHPHVHGANLGVRADAYLLAGGWMPLATAEDHDLWGRLKALGLSMLSDSRLVVSTSGRKVGRAPQGFAGALAAHNDTAVIRIAL